jgi:hypothetical protein
VGSGCSGVRALTFRGERAAPVDVQRLCEVGDDSVGLGPADAAGPSIKRVAEPGRPDWGARVPSQDMALLSRRLYGVRCARRTGYVLVNGAARTRVLREVRMTTADRTAVAR